VVSQSNRKAVWARGRNYRLLTSSWCDSEFLLLRQVSDSSTRLQQVELRRLKETKPDISHKERCVTYKLPLRQHFLMHMAHDRFKAAVESWNKSKPKT